MCDLKIHAACTGDNAIAADNATTGERIHACIECFALVKDPSYKPGKKPVYVRCDMPRNTPAVAPNFDTVSFAPVTTSGC